MESNYLSQVLDMKRIHLPHDTFSKKNKTHEMCIALMLT